MGNSQLFESNREVSGKTDASVFRQLEKIFNLDTAKSPLNTVEDAEHIIDWVREAFEYMAMTDYPYPTTFLKPLRGWPVNVSASFSSLFMYFA